MNFLSYFPNGPYKCYHFLCVLQHEKGNKILFCLKKREREADFWPWAKARRQLWGESDD
jgi:hypothetical protein